MALTRARHQTYGRMLGFYLFSAIVGVGALAFSLLGSDDGTETAGDGADSEWMEFGNILLAFLKPRNLFYFLAAFGVTGAALTLLAKPSSLALALAVAMGTGAVALNVITFAWIRRGDSSAGALDDLDLVGMSGRVVLPVHPGERGRIVCLVGGREHYVTARLASSISTPAPAGSEIVILEMRNGVADIAPFDPLNALSAGPPSI